MQQPFHYPVHPNMQGGQQGVGMGPGTSQRHEESFKSQATVFILKDKTWREQSQGVVQFVFDLNTYALRLIISPGTKEEMDRRLRPRIRSKGPRAYVVRAQAPNNGEDSILAVRFEREEDSQNFRKFVEKRDVDNNNPPNSHGNANTGASGNRGGGGMHTNTNNTNPQTVGTGQPYGQTYTQGNGNMYPNMGMMNQYTGKQGPAPTGQYPYDPYYQDPRNGGNGYYPNPNPQDYGSSTTPQQYRGPTSTMAQGGQTPHGSQHPSMGSYQYGPNNTGQNSGLLQRPTNNSQWQQQQNGGPPYGPSNEGIVNDHYGGNNNNNNNNNNNVGQNNNIDPNTGMPSQSYPNNHHGSRSGGANATINPGNQGNDPNSQPPQNVNILKLTEANLEAHNKVYAESSMANKRKNVRDIILEQLQWQRDHGMTSH